MKKPYKYDVLSDVQCAKTGVDGVRCQQRIKMNLLHRKSLNQRPGKIYCYHHHKEMTASKKPGNQLLKENSNHAEQS